MPRPKRADEKNAIYHALNRGNGPSVIFQKDGDYEAFENILAEGLARYPCRILSYQFRRIKGDGRIKRDGGSFAKFGRIKGDGESTGPGVVAPILL